MAALTRFTARTTPEILEAVARWCWHEKYSGKVCQRVPADAEIAEWLPNCPKEARDEANALLVQVIPGLVNPQWPDRTTWELLAMPDRNRATRGDWIREGTATGAVQVRHGATRQRGQRNYA